jgi:diguanylate cyclase (GGDEF)-like protein
MSLSSILILVFGMSEQKPLDSIQWVDLIGEAGIALITLCWLIVTLISRPKGLVTTLLFMGILMVHCSMMLDMFDEFLYYKPNYDWFSKFEAIPAVLGLIVMSVALFYWQKEQAMLNNRLIKSERFYREHSFYDLVTGLYSAGYMKKQIEAELNNLEKHSIPFCISIFDIKSFSAFSREQGITQANKLLNDIGSLIQVNIRPTDLACRYAADRFIVLLPNTELAMSHSVTEQVLKMVNQHASNHTDFTRFSDLHSCSMQVDPNDSLDSILTTLNNQLISSKKAA